MWHYLEAKRYLDKIPQSDQIIKNKANILNSIGFIYSISSNSNLAIKAYEEALLLASDSTYKAILLRHIGLELENLDNYDSAALFFKRALKYAKKDHQIFTIENSLAINFRERILYDSAIYVFESILAKGNLDSSQRAKTYHNLSSVYFRSQDYKTSISFLKKSLDFRGEKDEVTTLINLTKNYIEAEDFRQALTTGLKAESLLGEVDLKKYQIKCYSYIAEAYRNLGFNDKYIEYATLYNEKLLDFKETSDKVVEESRSARIKNITEKYDLMVSQLSYKNQMQLIIGVFGAIILAVVLLIAIRVYMDFKREPTLSEASEPETTS